MGMGGIQIDDRAPGTVITDGGGYLWYENGVRLPVIVTEDWIRIGCHRISKTAWALLKKLVDGK